VAVEVQWGWMWQWRWKCRGSGVHLISTRARPLTNTPCIAAAPKWQPRSAADAAALTKQPPDSADWTVHCVSSARPARTTTA